MSFGLDDLISSAVDFISGGSISPSVTDAITSVATPAIEGAATGALGAAVSGQSIGKGALAGGLSGGAVGAFGGSNGLLATTLGVSAPVADSIIGGLTGAGSSALLGQNALLGGAMGGIGGYLYGNTAYGNNGDTGNGTTDQSGMTGTNGAAITPPIPPQLDANGNPIAGTGSDGSGTGDTAADVAAANGQAGGALGASSAAATNNDSKASNTGGIFGNSKGGTGITGSSGALGILAALAQAASKPKATALPSSSSATVQQNLGPYFNQPLNTNVPGRTATNPTAAGSVGYTPASGGTPGNYWSYGGPEQTYFNNNSAAAFGLARGGALRFAHGGQQPPHPGEFSTANGQHFVRGPGTGTSDSVPAMLSDGEFVFDAQSVARAGGGSNEAGAKKLDELRKSLASDAGNGKLIHKKALTTVDRFQANLPNRGALSHAREGKAA
jgi:hypothetical protein